MVMKIVTADCTSPFGLLQDSFRSENETQSLRLMKR